MMVVRVIALLLIFVGGTREDFEYALRTFL